MPSRPNPRAAPLPDFVPPQLCRLVSAAPVGDDWLHEIKYDGYRMHARIERGEVHLLTRTGLNWTAEYPLAPDAWRRATWHRFTERTSY